MSERRSAAFERTVHTAVPFWRDIRVIQIVAQIAFLIAVVVFTYLLIHNLIDNLRERNLVIDYGMLERPFGTAISEGQNPFGTGGETDFDPSTASNLRALIQGFKNTLRVVVVGLVGATILGVLIGIGRLSTNFLVRNVAIGYIELFRNTPLLVQLYFIYRGLRIMLPEAIRDSVNVPWIAATATVERFYLGLAIGAAAGLGLWAWRRRSGATASMMSWILPAAILGGALGWWAADGPFTKTASAIYINVRAINYPRIQGTETVWRFYTALGIGLLIAAALWVWRLKVQDRTGEPAHTLLWSLPTVLLFGALGWLAAGSPFSVENPTLAGLNFVGGARISAEYVALTAGLILYTAAFIADIVRAGIQAVPHGQIEAARAQGFSGAQMLRLIVLPQAMRLIIPPLGNQYLNLAKNSSLGIAIGFFDVYNVAAVIQSQINEPVAVFTTMMLIYLALSLVISGIMNFVNYRMRLRSR